MIKRAIIILVVVNLTGFIISCCEEVIHFKWIKLTSELIDNSESVPKITDLDSINRQAFGINLSLQDSVLFYSSIIPQFINTASATSCARHYEGSNTIKDVIIKTLYDFDGLKLKNSDISEYFSARLSQDINSNYSSISEIVAKFNNRNTLNNRDVHGNEDKSFDLFLMDPITAIDTCQFQIEIRFSDSTSISCITRKFKLY